MKSASTSTRTSRKPLIPDTSTPAAPSKAADGTALVIASMSELRFRRRAGAVVATLPNGLALAKVAQPLDETLSSAAFAACEQVLSSGAVRLTDPLRPSRVIPRKVALANPYTGQVSQGPTPATVVYSGAEQLGPAPLSWAAVVHGETLAVWGAGAESGPVVEGLALLCQMDIRALLDMAVESWKDAGSPSDGVIIAVAGTDPLSGLDRQLGRTSQSLSYPDAVVLPAVSIDLVAALKALSSHPS